jgi:peptidoglycan/LPS O-acetylase OafA/YrhL
MSRSPVNGLERTKAMNLGWTERIIVAWVVVVSIAVAALRFGYIDVPRRERTPRPGMAGHKLVNSIEPSAPAPYLGVVRT